LQSNGWCPRRRRSPREDFMKTRFVVC